ncbi:hypothetical protein [Silvibacterium sp.]|uniref:hypothetical protein n=1 Tax=Silvibacterium sp. TaxID=1964179 RepID=UPI0039E6A4E0
MVTLARVAFTRRRMILLSVLALAAVLSPGLLRAETHWRAATDDELKSLLPARAPVEQERIEIEMRTASGITDGQGHFIAGVVLITAGYSADGKYSHFFLTQVPLRVGGFALEPGSYVIGWQHVGEALEVKFYEAATGRPVGTVAAALNPAITRVESFKVWPPADRSVMQIGRFSFPYRIGDTL